jgi:dihydrofolate reductase/thymidylate synthase
MRLVIFVACTKEGGMGYQNQIPWHLPSDLRRFRDITTYTRKRTYRNAVIMGRKTWESIGQKPLSNRVNIVISKSHPPSITKNLWFAPSLKEAVFELEKEKHFDYKIETAFLIGGRQIYQEGIQYPNCDSIYLTEVKYEGECDVFFPIEELKNFYTIFDSPWNTHEMIEYRYQIYNRKKN